MINYKKNSSALIYTLLFTALVAMMAFAAGKLIIAEMQQGNAQEASAEALNLANTAIEEGLYELNNPSLAANPLPEGFYDGTDFDSKGNTCPAFTCAVRFINNSSFIVNPSDLSNAAENLQNEKTGFYDLRIYTQGSVPEKFKINIDGSNPNKIIIEGVGYYKGYKRILRAIASNPTGSYTIESITETGSAG